MKPSEYFKGLMGRNEDYNYQPDIEASILALVEAVENTQIWEVRPTSTNTNPLPWLEEHALPGKDEANKQKILWAALALKEAK